MKLVISILNRIDLALYIKINALLTAITSIYTYFNNTSNRLCILICILLASIVSLLWDINEKVEGNKYSLLQMFVLKKTYNRVSSLLQSRKKHK